MTFALRTTCTAMCMLSVSLIFVRALVLMAWHLLRELDGIDISSHEWTDLNGWDIIAGVLGAIGIGMLAYVNGWASIGPLLATPLGFLAAAGTAFYLRLCMAASFLLGSVENTPRTWVAWVTRIPPRARSASPEYRRRLGAVGGVGVGVVIFVAGMRSAGADVFLLFLAFATGILALSWNRLIGYLESGSLRSRI